MKHLITISLLLIGLKGFGQEEDSMLIYTDSYGSIISIKKSLIPSELDTTFLMKEFNSCCNCPDSSMNGKKISINIWGIKRISRKKKYHLKFMTTLHDAGEGIEKLLKITGIQNWEIKVKKQEDNKLIIISCKFLYGEI